MRRLRRFLKWAVPSLVILLLLGAGWVWLTLRASLPRTGGRVRVAGLTARVEISRDSLGVPTIRGRTLEDVASAQGFVHAQDRYFQMDIVRRLAAGELSALLGAATLPLDRRLRVLRYRDLATAALSRLPQRHRRILDAYTRGVNAGLADLGARPPEYLLLRAEPRPWAAQDSVLMEMR